MPIERQSMPIEGYPLSPQQKRIWLLQQGDPNSPYRVHCNVLIEGNLDLHILKAALAEVWHRHEILRTAFRCPPGSDTPVQVILDEPPPPLTSLDLTNNTHDCIADRHDIAGDTHDFTVDRLDPTANHGDLLGHTHDSAGDRLDPAANNGDLLGHTLDLTDIDPSQHEARIDEFSEKANQLPFDFALGRLSHLSLVTLSPTRYNLLITLSALCADTASMDILTRAISLAYSTRITGSDLSGKVCYNQYFTAESGCADPAEKPSQYADLAAWQNAILESENTNPAAGYWRMQNFTPATSRLPFENQPTAKHNFKPLFLDAAIDPDTLTMIDTAARTYNVSRLTFFSTCWQIVLWYLTRDTDFVAGMICDCRTYEGLQDALGSFSKTVPLRCHLTEKLQCCEALHTTSELAREALEWQEFFSWDHFDYPGCGNPSDSNGSPDVSFLAAGFEFQDMAATYPTAGPVLSIQRQHGCNDRFKLKLCCVERNGLMFTELHYDSNLFLEEDIRRLIDHLHTLLESAAGSPDAAIGDLEFLSEAQRRQLSVEFNTTDAGDEIRGHLPEDFFATDARYQGIASAVPPLKVWRDSSKQSSSEVASAAAVVCPRDKSIHQLFEEQVERTPDNIAVVFDHLQLTYLELNGRANQLANHLRTLGVRPGVSVALSMERCLEVVVGLLGVLKAGGAYVPIDPHGPKDRQAFILEDTRAEVLLTQEYLVKRLPGLVAHTVCLDSEWSAIAENSETTPMNWATSRDAAYVIYTSGSTGQPKGVIVEHRGLSNAVNWIIETLELSSSDSCFLKTPITFDAAGRELFPVVLSGGALLIVEPDREGDCQYLAEMMRRQAISVLHCVPSLLRQLVEEPAFDDALKLRAVMCGGESLAASVVMRFQDRSKAKLYNVYGPTEASIDTAFWLCEPVGVDSPIPIGRPIPNSQIFILDDMLRLLPIGVAGNLHIGGVGLARGYLNRPDLTAEKFVPHPFSSEPGARLYQTGDLARYLADGNIEFLGRADHQVKIRGYRIELEEVEAVLARHPEIRHAAVVAQAEASGEQRLVAYVVNEPGRSPTITELRGFLQDHLPEYMVPAIFVTLEALPLTSNGKVDRNALPPPDGARPDLDKGFLAPRNPTEEMLAGLWVRILGVERVGIHDDFFQLGGHSLLATQLVSRMRETFQVDISLRRIFELPTVAGLAQSIDSTRRHGDPIATLAILPVCREGHLPLSFAQQRLWFLDQLDPGNSVYNFPAAVRLTGPLDREALTNSIDEVIGRHEALRTSFTIVDGAPIQVIAPTLTVAMPVIDLRALPEVEREAEMQRIATEEARRPFNLAEGPLLRITLLLLTEHEHVGLFTTHHIVSDGWSAGVIIREIALSYEAFSAGRLPSLPALPIQYADFAHWQRQWLQGKVLETQLSYWEHKLRGAPPLLDLPVDRPRPPIQTFKGAQQSRLLPKTVSEGFKALSRQEGVTLFMALLTAFNILLHRYTGQDDLVVGTPIANRNRLEIEGLIGFFANTLVIRTDLSHNPSFTELLGRVREVCLEAYAYQDLPFERLVEELRPERDLSRSPLFQTMFVLQNAPIQSVQLPGLNLSPVEVDSGTAHFDLILHMVDTGQGLTAALAYNTDLFEATTITNMLAHFQNLLEAVVANPAQHLSDLPLLSDSERHQLTIEWNDNNSNHSSDLCIPQLFEEQVKRTPDAIAVVFEDSNLTYRELDCRANQLARHLRSLGVVRETSVGICVERSPKMIVGLLAILKAGGVYVPLDPRCPKPRLAFMIDDTRMSVLLTEEQLVNRLPQVVAHILCLDSDWKTISKESEEALISSGESDDLAYIIFTSGSTGQPKGVMVSHRSLVEHCLAIKAYFELDTRDRVLQSGSTSFDLSLEEILPTLIAGAALIVQSRDLWLAVDFHKAITKYGLTVINLTTAYWQELAREWAVAATTLQVTAARLFVVGGDTLTPAALSLWRQTPFSSARLVNAYGPTEATITATTFEIALASTDQMTLQRIPIGRPLAGRETYILDRYGNLTPIGVAGNLHIGGVGLARGYLNRPDLTAEKFVPHPFSSEPGARLYQTGDLARYLADGNIEFLGRADHQVKIRGYRIELEEVEAVLARHPEIRHAAVVAQAEASGEQRLVAYVVNEPGRSPTITELRGFLQDHLPEYMVPAIFVTLEALPLTSNGKVDRNALPPPDGARPDLDKGFIAPRDVLELQLTQLWEEVLGVRPIGVRDNFFELGGHSLAAVRLFALIEHRLGRKLPLATVFQGATVEHLAIILRERTEHQSSLVAIQPCGDLRPLFLIHPAGGHVFPYVQLARSLGLNQPCYGLQAKGLEEGQEPHTQIEEMATYYIEALRTLQPEGPYHIGGWSAGGVVAFEMAQQLLAQGQQVALLALLDARIPGPEEDFADDDFEATLLADFIRYFGLSLDSRESLARLPKDELLSRVLAQAKLAGLVPQDVEASQAHPFIELCKADFRATRNYVPRRYPGRVTLFRAAQELAGISSDPMLGWSKWAAEGVEVHVVPGNHASMVYKPHVDVLAQMINECLKQVRLRGIN